MLATIGLFISGERNVEVARKAALAAKESADIAKKTWFLKPILIPYRPNESSEKDYSEPNKAVEEVHTDVENGGVLWLSGETKFWIPWHADDTPENKAILDAVLQRKISLIVDIAVAYITVGEERKSWGRYFLRDVSRTER